MDDPRYKTLAYYERLVLQIKREVVQGVRVPGDKLPSVRDMAKAVQLNPNTVAKAYKQLEAQGVIEVQPGRGTFIGAQTAATAEEKQRVRPAFEAAVVSAKAAGVTLNELQAWLNAQFEEGQA
ncbi:GntR family transcriptional regulator [Lacticaseibacillus hegangensis]|uniref:GntR family transcriptional regulator n=1 Tax=Lacticaseibacillus hegangensis TaxID=2486010 RepID=A0ABW4CXI8_9LACO|nr:GntR family transcriptional regulator [Lacticaseibacillus hegangensis]